MNKSDFYFELPDELIAQTPVEERSASRLMVIDKKTGGISHKVFSDITEYIEPGDCIVINDTKVIPARLNGHTRDGGAKIELLLLSPIGEGIWEALVKPGRKLREGTEMIFEGVAGGKLFARILSICEDGNRIVSFYGYRPEFASFNDALTFFGKVPLPPYIKVNPDDTNRYQTVYAAHEGSSAAPTAGLHFTPHILDLLREKNVAVANITLHIGLGTFRPVKTEDIRLHKMHSEHYNIEETQAGIINNARSNGKRIIAVGTTSCRTLEANADESGFLRAGSGATDIFIYPGYRFKLVDMLITNFHLPESTLIMLVSALCGKENVLNAYREAVKYKYRFYSFGDAMLIR